MDADRLEKLKDLIKKQAIVADIKGIKLSSGEISKFYYDLKKVMFDPVGIDLIADLLFEEIVLRKAKSVGAIPITTAILQKSAEGQKLN